MNSRLPALHRTILRNVRLIHRSRTLNSELSKDVKEKTNPSVSDLGSGLNDHTVSNMEKRILVWGGKYKKVEDVPNLVNQSVMEKARNKARIKISLIMCVFTLLGCFLMIYQGKEAASRGESINTINEKFRAEVVADVRRKKAESEK